MASIDFGKLNIATGNPYPEAEYVEIGILADGKKAVTIRDVKAFENQNGKGVHILADFEGRQVRMCTHGQRITSLLTSDVIAKTLEEGTAIDCRVAWGTTKNGRQILTLEPVGQ